QRRQSRGHNGRGAQMPPPPLVGAIHLAAAKHSRLPPRTSKFLSLVPALQFGLERMRMNTPPPVRRPHKVSLVRLTSRLVLTFKAIQLGLDTLVTNSGKTPQPLVPVEVNTMFVLTAKFRM